MFLCSLTFCGFIIFTDCANFDSFPCSGAILSIEINPSGETCYTASSDNTIRCWNLPSLEIDPYGQFGEFNYVDVLQDFVYFDA